MPSGALCCHGRWWYGGGRGRVTPAHCTHPAVHSRVWHWRICSSALGTEVEEQTARGLQRSEEHTLYVTKFVYARDCHQRKITFLYGPYYRLPAGVFETKQNQNNPLR